MTRAPDRLRFRDPVRLLFSPAPWVAFWYLFVSIVLGSLWFAAAFSGLAAGATLSIVWLGLPVFAFALALTRRMAGVERRRVRVLRQPPIPRPYRPVRARELRPRLAERLRDPAARRDAVLLVSLWVPLLLLDTLAVTVWLAGLWLVSLPIWYRYVPQTFDNGTAGHGVSLGNFPNGPHGGGSWGFLVDDMNSALIAAAVGLGLLVLIGNYVLVAAARAHAAVTRSMLAPAADPLAEARQMLVADPALSGTPAQRDM
jgi:hypothetical protein